MSDREKTLSQLIGEFVLSGSSTAREEIDRRFPRMTQGRLAEIAAVDAAWPPADVTVSESLTAVVHRRELLAEIGRLRALIAAAGAVVSDVGCDCTCHVRDVDDGEHDDDCDGPCVACRVADALQLHRRGAR